MSPLIYKWLNLAHYSKTCNVPQTALQKHTYYAALSSDYKKGDAVRERSLSLLTSVTKICVSFMAFAKLFNLVENTNFVHCVFLFLLNERKTASGSASYHHTYKHREICSILRMRAAKGKRAVRLSGNAIALFGIAWTLECIQTFVITARIILHHNGIILNHMWIYSFVLNSQLRLIQPGCVTAWDPKQAGQCCCWEIYSVIQQPRTKSSVFVFLFSSN